MKSTILTLVGAAAMLAMTACSSYSLVNSSVYNGADLAQYHTFHIVTQDEGNLPPGMTMVTYYNIAAAIREQLVDRGWTEDPNSPILVNIGLTVKKEVAYSAFTTPGVWVTPPPMWGRPLPPTPQQPPVASPEEQVPVNPALPDVPVQGGPGLVAPPAGSGMQLLNGQRPGQPNPAPQAPAPGPQGPQGPGPQPPMQRPLPGPVYNGYVPFYMFPRSYYIPGPTQIVPSVYREGVLSMDIIDMSTKTPLYSSSVATILDAGDTQFRDLKGIAEAVKVLFCKFPVPKVKSNE